MGKARLTIFVALTYLVSLASPAQADISFVDMFRSGFAVQTGDGATLTNTQFRFDTHLTSTVNNEFVNVQLTPGAGPSVLLLPTPNPTLYEFQSTLFTSQALMDLSFPTGTYTYQGNSATPDSTSFSYTGDNYPSAQPFLTGSDFSSLQGLNPSSSFTLDFNGFATNGALAEQFILLTIFDVTANTLVVNSGKLDETTTSFLLAANTLVANHDYRYELIYSNRLVVPSEGANFPATLAWELRTGGAFRTSDSVAVPEPSSLILLLLGGVGLLGIRRSQFHWGKKRGWRRTRPASH